MLTCPHFITKSLVRKCVWNDGKTQTGGGGWGLGWESCVRKPGFDGGRATGAALGEGVPGKLGHTAAELMIPRTSAALPLLPICPGQWW